MSLNTFYPNQLKFDMFPLEVAGEMQSGQGQIKCVCVPLLSVLHHFRLSIPQDSEGIFGQVFTSGACSL